MWASTFASIAAALMLRSPRQAAAAFAAAPHRRRGRANRSLSERVWFNVGQHAPEMPHPRPCAPLVGEERKRLGPNMCADRIIRATHEWARRQHILKR